MRQERLIACAILEYLNEEDVIDIRRMSQDDSANERMSSEQRQRAYQVSIRVRIGSTSTTARVGTASFLCLFISTD